jgi:hypothetical protein
LDFAISDFFLHLVLQQPITQAESNKSYTLSRKSLTHRQTMMGRAALGKVISKIFRNLESPIP